MNIEEFNSDEGREAVQNVINKCDLHAKLNLVLAVVDLAMFIYFYNNILLALFFSILCAFCLCLVWFNLHIKNTLIQGLEELDNQQRLKERLDKLKGK
jgi:hypothetical protein